MLLEFKLVARRLRSFKKNCEGLIHGAEMSVVYCFEWHQIVRYSVARCTNKCDAYLKILWIDSFVGLTECAILYISCRPILSFNDTCILLYIQCIAIKVRWQKSNPIVMFKYDIMELKSLNWTLNILAIVNWKFWNS